MSEYENFEFFGGNNGVEFFYPLVIMNHAIRIVIRELYIDNECEYEYKFERRGDEFEHASRTRTLKFPIIRECNTINIM